jgi:hypothetical protein
VTKSKCPSSGISIRWNEYYPVIKKNEVPIGATTWMNLENMVNERRHTRYIYFPLCETPKIRISTEAQSRLRVARNQEKGKWGVTVNR